MTCCTIGAMCGGSLCPAISSGRSWFGMFVMKRSVSLPARHVLRDPPRARPLFALGAPEGVYLSAVGMPISPPLVRAARPRQNDEKCLDLKKPQGDLALCAISKPHRGPATRKPLPRNAEG